MVEIPPEVLSTICGAEAAFVSFHREGGKLEGTVTCTDKAAVAAADDADAGAVDAALFLDGAAPRGGQFVDSVEHVTDAARKLAHTIVLAARGRLDVGNKIPTDVSSQPSAFSGGRTLDVLNKFLGDPKISNIMMDNHLCLLW